MIQVDQGDRDESMGKQGVLYSGSLSDILDVEVIPTNITERTSHYSGVQVTAVTLS